jgi:hypothetical protein
VFLAATSIAGNTVGIHKGHERTVSKKEALSIIAKLRAGKSSVMAEARRLGCYHATIRKELRATLGSKEYAKLADQVHHRRRRAPSPRGPRQRKLSAGAKTPRRQVPSPPTPTPTPEPRSAKDRRRLDTFVEIVAGKTVELKLGESRVLLLQRLGDSVRITSARRTPRTLTDALVLGGTVIVPRASVSDACDALREAARLTVTTDGRPSAEAER